MQFNADYALLIRGINRENGAQQQQIIIIVIVIIIIVIIIIIVVIIIVIIVFIVAQLLADVNSNSALEKTLCDSTPRPSCPNLIPLTIPNIIIIIIIIVIITIIIVIIVNITPPSVRPTA